MNGYQPIAQNLQIHPRLSGPHVAYQAQQQAWRVADPRSREGDD
jgi:hypothetical protein